MPRRTTGKKESRPGGLKDLPARLISILIELLRTRRLPVERAAERFGVSERQLLRDLQQLRGLGETLGFTITRRKNGHVELGSFEARPGMLVGGERALRTLIVALFKAFGEPLRPYVDGLADAQDDSGFVHFVMPRLIEGSAVATTLAELQAAWERHARVRFRYNGKEREVEPALALVRSGRYYLVGRQCGGAGNDWRDFAMDKIVGPIRRCGTFTPKTPPAEYVSTDTLGWMKTGKRHRVEVTFSPLVARTAISRIWETSQEARKNADGTWTLALTVGDVDEAIRWALGFGPDAWISAPPEAVAQAKILLTAVNARYAASREATTSKT